MLDENSRECVIDAYLRVGLVAVIGCLGYFLFQGRHWRENSPPGPWGLPVIGHLPFMTSAPHKKFTEWSKRYGNVFRIQLGSHPAVVVSGLEQIRSVLMTNDSELRRAISGRPKFASMQAMNGGDTMLFKDYSTDPHWGIKKRAMRQSLSGFMKENKPALEEIMLRRSRIIAEDFIAREEVEPGEALSVSCIKMLLEMSCHSLQGDEENPAYKLHTQKIAQQFFELAKQQQTPLPDILPWLSVFFRSNLRNIQNTSSVIASAYVDLLTDNVRTFKRDDLRDLTDHFLATFSKTPELRGRCKDTKDLCLLSEFLGAFESTSGTILRWSFLLCAAFPEEQAKLHAELEAVIGDEDVTFDSLKRLTRLNAFVAEVKRFAVPMPTLLPHRTIAACELGGFHIPKDTLVMFNTWSALHDPQHWEDPGRFKPERFIDSDGGILFKRFHSFLHFGAGERKCPGQRLGQTGTNLVFANILRRCRIAARPGHKVDLEPLVRFNLTPKPFRIIVTPTAPA